MSEPTLSKPIDRLADSIRIAKTAQSRYKDDSEIAEKWASVIQDFEYAIMLLEGAGDLSKTGFLVEQVRKWATDRRIIGVKSGSTPLAQFDKLLEEVKELDEGLQKNDQHECIDAIGDCTVVLINLAEMIGCPFEKCLAAAYDEIKDRKGQMIEGKFVKEADLPQNQTTN